MSISHVFQVVVPLLIVSWWAEDLPSCLAFSSSTLSFPSSHRTAGSLVPLHQSTSAIADTTTKDTTTDTSTTTTSSSCSSCGVKSLFVCTGHLCQGPEDSESADDILNALHNDYASQISSTTTVEESVCLGQCGLKAVVAMDYEDGTSKVCFGLEEVLQELGIENNNKAAVSSATQQNAEGSTADEEKVKPALSSSIVIEDPRQRMRAAAAEQKAESNDNPWMMAASLLTKKMFGQE